MFDFAIPSPDLAESIEMFWAYAGRGGAVTQHELLPCSAASLVFRTGPTGHRLVLMGPNTEKATIEIDNASDYYGIRFRTAGLPRLADADHPELINGRLDLDALNGMGLDALAWRVAAQPGAAGWQRVAEECLRDCAPLVADERCRQAGLLLDEHHGHLRVEELAERVSVHVRTLERAFRTHLGVTPKRLARLVRLKTVSDRLRATEGVDLAELAHNCGYADQAHMIRDFKGLTGLLPGSVSPDDDHRVDEPQTRIVHRHRP